MAISRPPRWHVVLLAGLAIVLLSLGGGAGNAAASVSDYPTTLYLSTATSSRLATSETLVTGAGPGPPAAAPTAVASGAGALVPGSYTYEYTVVSATGGETTPSPTVAVSVSGSNQTVTVGNLQTGVTVRLYRKGSSNIFRRVAEYLNNGSATQIDNMSDATANSQPLLPQSQIRQVAFATGYYEFVPAGALSTSSATNAAVSPLATPPSFSGKGWLVDAPGRLSIPSGTWTFTNTIKGTGGGASVAHLVIGMWKVDDSGNVIGTPIIDPASAGENTTANIYTVAGTASAIVTTINGVGAITLAAGEHLYVQFWRKQITTAASSTTTLYVYDGVTKIVHPAANGFPDVPVLGAIAARVKVTPQLSTTFSDPDGSDTGTVSIELCGDSACAGPDVQPLHTVGGLANGAPVNWTPTALADGTYYWRATAVDSYGNPSVSSAISSFVVDTTSATTPPLVSPANTARVNSSQLSATFSDPDATDSGTIDFQLCSDALCSTVVASTTSAIVNKGTNATWTPAVADGTYYWRARAQDVAGNSPSAWSAIQSFRLDTTPASTPPLVSPADAAHVNSSQLSATFSDPDATDSGTIDFQLCSDALCSTVVASTTSAIVNKGTNATWTPAVADGTYYWRARGTDAVGNPPSAWSAIRSLTLDTTAPTAAPGVVAARTKVTPLLSATYSDAGSTGKLSLELCSSSTCTSVVDSASSASGLANGAIFNWTPASLADGTYYWRASALDAAGNLSAWSATSSFVVDTTSATTPPLVSPANTARVNSSQLSATFSDPDATDSGTIDFQLCSDALCSTVVTSTTSAIVNKGTNATWTPAVADGTYYWRARGTDAVGNPPSAWSATRSLVLDTVAPTTPVLGAPANASYLATAPTLHATFADSDVGDTGSLVFQICTDSACATVVATGSSPTGLTSGTSGSWTPSSLAGGDYYWRAAGLDAAGNQSAWSATLGFTLDKTAPDVPTVTIAGGATRFLQIPSVTATYADPGAATGGSLRFQLCRTSSCASPVATTTDSGVANGATGTWTPAGIPDGTYYVRASAQDTAGNESAWSAVTTFILDTTSPAVPAPTTATAAISRVRNAPMLSASLDDPGDSTDSLRMLVELCSDVACADVIATGYSVAVQAGAVASWQSGALPDGAYYWRAAAEDVLGALSAWSAPRQFSVDTVAPSAPEIVGPDDGAIVKKARLTSSFASADAADAGRLAFQVCTDEACTIVVASGVSTTVGPSGRSARLSAAGAATWTAGDLPDGSYFWRTRAWDAAGNGSVWSATQRFTLDRTPPGKPRAFSATASRRTLTLRWQSPAGALDVAGYALLVNNRTIETLDAGTLIVRLRLRDGDKRSFAIAAIDEAGNVGEPTAAFLTSTGAIVKQAQARRTPATPAPARQARRK